METEIEVTLASAHDLKNINWKKGHLKPYAVAWVDSGREKRCTEVDYEGGCHPIWNTKLSLHLRNPLKDAVLILQIRHKDEDEDEDYEEAEAKDEFEEEKRRKKKEKKLIVGKAELPLQEVSDAGGFQEELEYKLSLKRPSGRPQGELRFSVRLKPIEVKPTWPPQSGYGHSYNNNNYGYPPQYYSNPYSQYPAPAPGYNYGPPPPMQGYPPYPSSSSEYPMAAPPSGYPPYSGYPTSTPYPQEEPKKESKYGFGTGLAVGALAGAVGGLAIAEGIDAITDDVEEEKEEEVEEVEEEEEEEEEDGGDYDE